LLCPGHGAPLVGGVRREIAALLRSIAARIYGGAKFAQDLALACYAALTARL